MTDDMFKGIDEVYNEMETFQKNLINKLINQGRDELTAHKSVSYAWRIMSDQLSQKTTRLRERVEYEREVAFQHDQEKRARGR